MIRPRQGYSLQPDACLAAAEVAEQIHQDDPVGVLYFASGDYDHEQLAQSMASLFPCPTWGCGCAGVFGAHGYHAEGLQAVSLAGSARITASYCHHLQDEESIRSLGRGLHRLQGNAFAVMLLDGLSQKEEDFVHRLYPLAGRIPLVGGSTGGKLDFQHTWLAVGPQVYQGGGLVLMFEVDVPFRLLKFSHTRSSERRFVVTGARPEQRIVHEINGKPAAREYARILDLAGELSQDHLALHPWVLELGGRSYLRSIREVQADGGLRLYCRTEEGLVLSAGFPLDPIAVAEQALAEARRDLGPISLLLGFDCILRRLELERTGLKASLARLMAQENMVGFNSFGEQFESVHMNQTFTGVALGSVAC